MPSPTRFTQSLCVALLAAAVLVGCGGAEEDSTGSGSESGKRPAASGKPSAASDQERAYYGCLEEKGVKIETTSEGELRVAKDGGDKAALTKAEGECADLLPARDTPADEGRTAKADPAFAACMKAEGFDKTTYDRAEMDGNDALVAALKKCGAGRNGDQGITVGG